MKECVAFVIEGRVQGVFFRANTQQEAQKLALTGFVRNEPDGSVFIIACGEPDALTAFETWLWQGPEQAQVTNVSRSPSLLGPFDAFTVEK